MAYRSVYNPKNPQKYAGDASKIVCRSLWERNVCKFCDETPHIIKWSSEEIAIPYVNPIDKKVHTYYPDFLVQFKNNSGTHNWMIEVKPKKQTREPEQQKRKTKKYINEVVTWGVNQAKWKAANEYCLDRGWEFKIITEEHLGL